MGGRGSNSFSPGRRGFPKTKYQASSSLGTNVSTTLRQAIGTKGEPYSVSDSVQNTNPNFNRSYAEYSENCQRCVVAYELRRRGYDVEALPTYQGDNLPSIAYRNAAKGTIEGRWKGAFRNARNVNVGAKTEAGAISNIESAMGSYGNGARGVVQIFYKGGGGHVFNVENQGGKVVYIEAQSGKIKDIKATMAHVKPESVNLIRTDNLRISERAKNFVTKRRNR